MGTHHKSILFPEGRNLVESIRPCDPLCVISRVTGAINLIPIPLCSFKIATKKVREKWQLVTSSFAKPKTNLKGETTYSDDKLYPNTTRISVTLRLHKSRSFWTRNKAAPSSLKNAKYYPADQHHQGQVHFLLQNVCKGASRPQWEAT